MYFKAMALFQEVERFTLRNTCVANIRTMFSLGDLKIKFIKIFLIVNIKILNVNFVKFTLINMLN